MPGSKKSPAQLNREIAEILGKPAHTVQTAEPINKNLCAYCGKPTRKGSLVMDEGQTAHRSCYREFEGR